MTVNDHPQDLPLTLHELGSTYADSSDRYVVSLIATDGDHEATSPADAVAHTLNLTRDCDADGTHWYAFDRQTHQLHRILQRDAEKLDETCVEDTDDER